MKLLHPYISYKEAINPDVCQKIISLGLSKIEENKKKGISTQGSTLNEKHKNRVENDNILVFMICFFLFILFQK